VGFHTLPDGHLKAYNMPSYRSAGSLWDPPEKGKDNSLDRIKSKSEIFSWPCKRKSSFSAIPAWQSGPGYGGAALLFLSALAVASDSFTIATTAGPLSSVIPDAPDPDGRQA
jgi:hypothetical protein